MFADERGLAHTVHATAVVLASGGFGGLYARTTTPRATLGAGIAMAARAGATLADLEFVQFHPTALNVVGDPLPLISEAVRGEGARLVLPDGERFVDELAPRDVVARAIAARERQGERVSLDAREALGESFPEHFPGIFAECMSRAIDPRTQRIPVTPAAHYTIGGVATDEHGRTTTPGLWACGEVAATGLHGANRLASNSLMEAAVFGTRVAADIMAANAPRARLTALRAARPIAFANDLAAQIAPLRHAMSEHAGVVRDRDGLETLLALSERLERQPGDPRVRDAALVARLVAQAALARRESRGAHFRSDYPASDVRQATRSFITEPAMERIS
jgi:L-aspartate oxidase